MDILITTEFWIKTFLALYGATTFCVVLYQFTSGVDEETGVYTSTLLSDLALLVFCPLVAVVSVLDFAAVMVLSFTFAYMYSAGAVASPFDCGMYVVIAIAFISLMDSCHFKSKSLNVISNILAITGTFVSLLLLAMTVTI